jgi:(1->4)-alpha-D-glucan 1-alpha-D-glucosylmutase
MAKGIEDTAFYRYHRLTALNEVGGSPGEFGLPVDAWDEHCERLARDWPATMTTLSTHDTKRSEDVRARLLVLAEIPQPWGEAVSRWRAAAQQHGPPDANTDYLFWQTLVGAWPIDVDRMQSYLAKATREAKQHTSWTDPVERYDEDLRAYAERVLADTELTSDVDAWVRQHVRRAGDVNALSQKLLQLTMPGVPDVYQGQEMPDRSLVDPDNRRPVDYADRAAALDALDSGAAVEPKLLVTAAALRLRRARPDVFGGSYRRLRASGSAAGHVIAFARATPDDQVLTVATRLPVGLERRGGWSESTLPAVDAGWHDVLTGRRVTSRLDDILAEMPVALLVRDRGRGPT